MFCFVFVFLILIYCLVIPKPHNYIVFSAVLQWESLLNSDKPWRWQLTDLSLSVQMFIQQAQEATFLAVSMAVSGIS